MTLLDFLLLVVVPSGVIGAISGGIVNHLSNRKLDSYKRMMDVRKQSYTEINDLLSTLYDTVKDEETKRARSGILKLYREIQLWGSDEVLKSLQHLLFAIDVKNGIAQEERNLAYKSYIVAMRRDMLGETDIKPEEIQTYGSIN